VGGGSLLAVGEGGGGRVSLVWVGEGCGGEDFSFVYVGGGRRERGTSLMTVSKFWLFRGVARGFARREVRWVRTSWLLRTADWVSRIWDVMGWLAEGV